ncbi:unnamed protein product [Vitrella brassicaformis CCMP3155]|uniref:BTB domain-containing protein n=2 Tax=Vitrella brassicaformis TaxID=1169539 RepID=A0A0G4FFB1_VITBC|nr:unnamed protein product [Vitrella brassicaformis CCMP3155]|eukprot:CEM11885.1 unnamed protein product [Vitrella brassicaformis CCMP3155]
MPYPPDSSMDSLELALGWDADLPEPDESPVCEVVFIKRGEDPDSVGEGRRLRVSREILMEFEYFRTMESLSLSSHRVQPSNRFVIVDVDSQVAAIVLQSERAMVKSLTEDNFIDVLVALEYFTGGCSHSVLKCIATKIDRQFLGDSVCVMALLQSLDQPPIGRLISGHLHRTALADMVIHHPECIKPLYNRVPGDEARQAAIVLVDNIDRSSWWPATQQMGHFLTEATNSPSLRDALHKVSASRKRSLHTHTIEPFQPFGTTATPVTLQDLRVTIRPWKVCRCAPMDDQGHKGLEDESVDTAKALHMRIAQSGHKVTEVTKWQVLTVPAPAFPGTACHSISGVLTIERKGQPPVTLHSIDDFVSPMCVTIDDEKCQTSMEVANLPADELVRQGVGDVRLKKVTLRLTVTRYPYATVALHYLRVCIEQRKWSEINQMSHALGKEARETVLEQLCHLEPRTTSRLAAVVGHWCRDAITELSPELSAAVARVPSPPDTRTSTCPNILSTYSDDMRVFLEHVLPLMQPSHQRQWCEEARAVGPLCQLLKETKADRDCIKDLRRTIQNLQTESALKDAEIARLKAKLGEASRDRSGVSSTDKASSPTSTHADCQATTSTTTTSTPAADSQRDVAPSPPIFIFGRQY